ncbi:hypothetical protein Ocin01_01018 [Orchesella cincta]|uniref:Uncharacterized protein n=1 Tax=Orchesella cincta TaxID=48709 RepID=A0A1D2NKB2_ORCCI|nr:hypothetical protein Ocin01_01018 [Orchesella cincta]
MPVASSVRNQMMRLFRKGNKKGKGLVNKDASGSTSINTANSCYSELSEDNSSQIFKRSKSRRGSKLFRSIRKRFSRSKSYLQSAVTPNASKLGDSEAEYQESEPERFGSKGDSTGEVQSRGAERIRRRYSKRENRKSCPPPMRQILDEEDIQFSGGDSECGDGKAPLLLVPGGSGVSQGPSSGVLSSCSYGDMKKDISPVVVVVEPPAEYCDPGTIGASSDQGKSSLVDSKIKEPGSGGGTTTPSGGGGGGEPSSASSSRRPSVEMSACLAPIQEAKAEGVGQVGKTRVVLTRL